MHTYTRIAKLSTGEFKRLTGVSQVTFKTMVDIVRPMFATRQLRGGPRYTHSIEDMMLMALTYWREYRTYFHLATDYSISESQCFKIIRLIEDELIKDKRFHIQGKRRLSNKPTEGTYITIDVAESPIERPKKKGEKTSKNITIPEKRNATH